MRILITGGAGFIGSHVAERLTNEGHDVSTIDDLSVGLENNLPDNVRIYQNDISEDNIEKIFRSFKPDAVCHLAAHHYIPYCRDHPGETYTVNAWGTDRVLEACQECNVEKLVHASSAAVYTPAARPHSETDPTVPTDVYGRSKLVSERLVHNSGIDQRILRLFNVFGPRETNPHLIPEIIDQIKEGNDRLELGNLKPKRDFIHVNDVARAFEAALTERTNHSIFNVGSGKSYSVREVVQTVNSIIDEPVEIVQDDDRVRESDRPFLEASIERAKTELNWSPTITLKEGLTDLLETVD